MFNLFCPVCGKEYHADETHLGKQIQCGNPECGEIFTIARHDDRFSNSGRDKRQEVANRIRWKRPLIITGVATVLLGIVIFIGYSIRAGRHEHSGSSTNRGKTGDMVAPAESQDAHAGQSSNQPVNGPPIFSSDDAEVRSLPIHSRRQDAAKATPVKREMGATADHGTLVPSRQIASQSARSLPTGTRIFADQDTSGHGELEIVNGTPHDSCIILLNADTNQRLRKIYIKAQDSFTLDHLNPRNYKVLFATGVDWNDDAERFNREASYFEFGKVLTFQESSDSRGVHYDHQSITLDPGLNGNVGARRITEAEFHSLTGKN